MPKGGLAVAVLTAALSTLCAGASAGPERAALSIMRVATGLDGPLHVAAPRSEPGRIYIVEQPGRVRVLEKGRLRTFLDIRNLVGSGGERGLLSIAFHPNYAANRRFYVDYTDRNGNTNVVEYRSNGRTAIRSSARRLMFVRQPYANHNGGQLAFGPDGRLYVGMGDGGSGGDPENRAQNPRALLGKLISINVATKGARIEAIGLRNPWRFSWDRATNDFYLADVGQNRFEEVNYLRRGWRRTINFGWDVYEGRARFEQKQPSPGRLVFPVAVYGRAQGCSVTGGFVYRGTLVPAARGRYFYGDFCSGTVWSFKIVSGKAQQLRREPFRVPSLSSFGEDARGELYLTSLGGSVYRLAR